MSGYVVEIERLVLTDLGLSSQQAEQVRRLAAQELERMLALEGLPARPREDREVGEVEAQPINLPLNADEIDIAHWIALSIYRLLAANV